MNKDIRVQGSKVLKEAFIKELRDIGYTNFSKTTDIQILEENLPIGIYPNINPYRKDYMAEDNKSITHYLPENWDSALQAFKDYKNESCQKEYKIGDFVWVENDSHNGIGAGVSWNKQICEIIPQELAYRPTGLLASDKYDFIVKELRTGNHFRIYKISIERPATSEEIEKATPKIEVGSIVYSLETSIDYKEGQLYKVSSITSDCLKCSDSFPSKNANKWKFHFRLATLEEAKSYKETKEINIKCQSSEGSFDVKVVSGRNQMKAEDGTFDISNLKELYKIMTGIDDVSFSENWKVGFPYVNVGCKQSIPAESIKEIIEAWDKLNK